MTTGILNPSEVSTMLLAAYSLAEGASTPETYIKKLETIVMAHLIESAEKERLLGLSTK